MNGQSFYKEKLKDYQTICFTEEFLDIKSDGNRDESVEFQNAINSVFKKAGSGVLFVLEGK